jgi:hypothetical protein
MKHSDTYPRSEENMSLYEQISDEITLMDAGEQKWIGQDLPLESALLHKDLKCKAPLIEPNLRRNLGKWST